MSAGFKNDSPFLQGKEEQSKIKDRIGGISPRHQNHKTRRQQTTLQNANQSIATAKVDRNKKEKLKMFQNHQ